MGLYLEGLLSGICFRWGPNMTTDTKLNKESRVIGTYLCKGSAASLTFSGLLLKLNAQPQNVLRFIGQLTGSAAKENS